MATNAVLAKLAIQISANTAELGKALLQSQGQLKGFAGAVLSIGKTLGGVFGAVQVFNGIKDAIGIMAAFERTMSEVKAITGATGKEFNDLEKDALKLGASTKFSAQQVGQLQIAYGRLGFNTKEILDATEATLDLAAATGEDLAKSADVAGATVRGFGLEARETQRVVDVMAKSFNSTALGLENFTESMKYVAPVAAAANLSLEETTALLGTLADAGIRGSMAGTALRKILTDLPKDGRPFQERLDELAKKGITVSDAMDEVGRTAQTALLILSKNNDKTKQLAASFQSVEGEAAKMARTMSDNLTGDVEKLTGAWEGLILALGETSVLRNATQNLTSFLNALTGAEDSEFEFKKLAQAIKEGSEPAIAGFIERLKDIRRESGKPIDLNIVNEIAEKYKLSSEQANKLYQSLLQVNEALSFQEKAIGQFKDFAQRNGYEDLSKAADDYKQRLYDLILAEQIQKEQLVNTNLENVFGDAIKESDEQIAAYRRVIGIINEYSNTFVKSEAKVQAATVVTIKNLNYYQESLKKVTDAFESLALSQDASGKFTEQTLSNLRILAAESAGLEEFINRVNRLKDSFRDFDVIVKAPDLTPLVNGIKTVKESAGALTFETEVTSFEAVVKRFEAGLAKLAVKTQETTSQIKEQFIDFGGVIHSAISGIGQALGNAIGGGESFGKALLGVLGGVLVQLGEMLITAGLGIEGFKKALSSLNGYVAIAAGIALVAIGTAVGASIKKLGSSAPGASPTASASSSSTSSRSATEAQDVKITGTIVGKGQDIYVILKNYEDSNKFLKAGG
jgi:hypothetical protein